MVDTRLLVRSDALLGLVAIGLLVFSLDLFTRSVVAGVVALGVVAVGFASLWSYASAYLFTDSESGR